MRYWEVDYSYKKNNVTSRTRLAGNTISLGGAQSDFAVQSYVQQKHPGAEIYIYSIKWE